GYRCVEVADEPEDPVSLNRSVIAIDVSPDSHVVSLDATLRLPASFLDLRRPAEVVAQVASVRVRQGDVVEVAVSTDSSDGLDFRDLLGEADAKTVCGERRRPRGMARD